MMCVYIYVCVRACVRVCEGMYVCVYHDMMYMYILWYILMYVGTCSTRRHQHGLLKCLELFLTSNIRKSCGCTKKITWQREYLFEIIKTCLKTLSQTRTMYLQRGPLTAENETTTHRTHRTQSTPSCFSCFCLFQICFASDYNFY
jgi:hypothetical protein